jgi:Na+/melibiose symporter-like transporter
MMWLLDAMLMLSHGIAGCLILFMFCFSEHPAVDSNWLIGVLNPLPLILMPFTIKAAWHGRRSMWHYFMAVWMAVFLLFIPWMPQQMPLLLIPLLSTLLGRQVSYILHYSRMPASKLATNRKKAAKKKK